MELSPVSGLKPLALAIGKASIVPRRLFCSPLYDAVERLDLTELTTAKTRLEKLTSGERAVKAVSFPILRQRRPGARNGRKMHR